jgi:signal transduction histidine kinase
LQEAPGALGVLAVALELPPEGVERVVHLFRERPSERAIAVPLIAEGRALGVFVVRGADLREADVPAFELMADQVSHALERLGRARKVAELEILRETDRMRAELIANVSHEIRTPLGMIDVLCTSLLADDVAFDAETQRSFLGGIKEATDRLAAMVGNLLQLSRAEDGRLVLHRRPTDLGKLATAVVERVRVGAPRHQLICSEQEAEHVALVDPEQMEQVLSNLLSNAIKYSPDGGPIVVTLAWQGEELILSVSDQGIGIPEEEQERIFERFYRVDDAIGRKVSGAGLGLAVCRAVVEAHGGKIRVASRLGMGSTFYVSLPTNPASPAVYGR